MGPGTRAGPNDPIGPKSRGMEVGTFKSKVGAFWDWWAAEGARLAESVSSDGGNTVQPEVSAQVDRLMPGLAWVFGPGEGDGHSFTLTGEGNSNFQFLTYYWLKRAPKIPGWTFFSARQAEPDVGPLEIVVDDLRISAGEIWLAPEIDKEGEEIDIMAWHSKFDEIGENRAFHILFILLDAALGEHGTENWLGTVELGDSRLKSSIPLSELPEFVAEVEQDYGWEKGPPEETYSLYKIEEPPKGFARSDIYVGATRHFRLCREFLNEEGRLDDPVEGSGAEYVYVRIDVEVFPDGGELDYRVAIEDALEEALNDQAAGLVLGGAMGAEYGYVDLLFFAGGESERIVEKVLEDRGLVGRYSVLPFAVGA